MTSLSAEFTPPPEEANMRRLRRGRVRPGIALAALILAFLVVCGLWPSLIAPYDPYALDLLQSLKPPSWSHIFGTDQLGRDIFSRVVHGASYSLYVGIGATLIAVAVGIAIGLVSGVAGGFIDLAFMRVVDILLAFPGLLMSMAVVAFLGTGITNVLLAIAIAAIPSYARIVRSQVLVIRNSGFVEAARILGQSPTLTLFRHILPNTIGPLVVLSTLGIGSAILHSASLSYLGLGPKAPTPEWGLMLSEGQSYLKAAWWIGVFPGVFATLAIVSTTVLGRYIKAYSEGRA